MKFKKIDPIDVLRNPQEYLVNGVPVTGARLFVCADQPQFFSINATRDDGSAVVTRKPPAKANKS